MQLFKCYKRISSLLQTRNTALVCIFQSLRRKLMSHISKILFRLMFQNNKDFLYWIISVHTYIVIGMDFPECICPKRYIKTVYNNNRRDSHFQFFNQYFPYRPLGPIFYLSDSCERFKRFLIKNLNLFCLQPSRIVDIQIQIISYHDFRRHSEVFITSQQLMKIATSEKETIKRRYPF